MKKLLIKIYKKLLYGYKSDSKSYIKYLRKNGVEIGDNVSFYEPNTNYIDTQKGFLIKIGNNVEITRGVVIITHDYSWSVFKQITGDIIGSRETVNIGNNVFVGINTVILKGVNIGNNVVIGANSVITKNVPDNSIVVGNPATIINNIDQFYKKRKELYLNEAKEMFKVYYMKYNTIPDKKLFDEFFWLFEKRNNKLIKEYVNKIKLTNNEEKTMKVFYNSKPTYEGYDKFCKVCLEEIKNKEKQNNE